MGIRNVSVVPSETLSINPAFYHPVSDYEISRFISYTSTHKIHLLRNGVAEGRPMLRIHTEG